MRGKVATDLTGREFGRLTVLSRAGSAGGHATWKVRCACGVEKVVSAGSLVRGNVKSCGCLVRTHNLSRSSTYKSWQMMWQRCSNPANDNYKRYGAKGISVCDRWKDFENFYADMGDRPIASSLDRIDGKGNYEPENCRWATREQQGINTTRWAGYSTLDGERISLRAMAKYLAITEPALRWRLSR